MIFKAMIPKAMISKAMISCYGEVQQKETNRWP
jgi:hypothetical protein